MIALMNLQTLNTINENASKLIFDGQITKIYQQARFLDMDIFTQQKLHDEHIPS